MIKLKVYILATVHTILLEITDLHPIYERSASDSGNKCRILRPIEFEALVQKFAQRYSKYVKIPIALLVTGTRYAELVRISEHPEWHIYPEKLIDPQDPISQKKRTSGISKARIIYLSDYGNERVKSFFQNLPFFPSINYMDEIIDKMAKEAGMKEATRTVTMRPVLKDAEGNAMKDPDTGKKMYGSTRTVEYHTTAVSEKSMRKTWVSWLMTCYPEFEARITASMGHDSETSRKYYQTYRFSDDDIDMMEKYVSGFIPARLLEKRK
jgi:hypothetical protein